MLTRIDEQREETVELFREIVAVNSVNADVAGVRRSEVIGGKIRVNEILCERYEQAGLETH